MKRIALFLLISMLFAGCVKSLENEGIYTSTKYTGRVVEGSLLQPVPGVKVILTDGYSGDTLAVTDQTGAFAVQLATERIEDGDYLELLYEPLFKTMRLELVGLGEKTHDFGSLVLYEAEVHQLPEVRTDSVMEIGEDFVVLSGTLISEGDSAVIELGFCVDTIFNPSFPDSSRSSEGILNEGPFVDTITALLPGTHYYYRAYAKNVYGIVYGDCLEFTTVSETGEMFVITGESSEFITKAHSITGFGTLSCSGETDVVCGMLWNTDFNLMTLEQAIDFTVQEGVEGGFSSTANNLDPSTRYYLRMYAYKDPAQVLYGEMREVITDDGVVEVLTEEVDSITSSTAWGRFVLNDDGGLEVFSGGICWSKSPSFTLEDAEGCTRADTISVGEIVPLLMTGLERLTEYYVMAYCITEDMTVYGRPIQFTTLADLPELEKLFVTETTGSTAKYYCMVKSDGGSEIIQCGVFWGVTEEELSLDNCLGHTEDVVMNGGLFQSQMTGLLPSTHYYVKAYARNNAGIVVGETVEFDTKKTPEVLTREYTVLDSSLVCLKGEVLSIGDGELIERGVCWGLETDPTEELDHQADSIVGTGLYSVIVKEIEPGVLYHYRAYAKNSYGTAYGIDRIFSLTNR